jgi:hypothetical protein
MNTKIETGLYALWNSLPLVWNGRDALEKLYELGRAARSDARAQRRMLDTVMAKQTAYENLHSADENLHPAVQTALGDCQKVEILARDVEGIREKLATAFTSATDEIRQLIVRNLDLEGREMPDINDIIIATYQESRLRQGTSHG